MDRHYLVTLLFGLVAIVGLLAFLTLSGPPTSDALGPDQQYPEGAGPEQINFSMLDSDEQNVSHTPREYWDSFAIIYTAPPGERRVEGDYFINSSSGEIISVLWDNAKDYRNDDIYAYVQPTDGISRDHEREELEADGSFVYDNATDAFYRYDTQYGRLAPTNIGRHTNMLTAYSWEAVDTTTHHGIPVIEYRATGKRNDSTRASPVINGTLHLGVDDGIIYTYDVTVKDGKQAHQFTYEVRPAPFPDHDWVTTAKELAARNTTNTSAPGR